MFSCDGVGKGCQKWCGSGGKRKGCPLGPTRFGRLNSGATGYATGDGVVASVCDDSLRHLAQCCTVSELIAAVAGQGMCASMREIVIFWFKNSNNFRPPTIRLLPVPPMLISPQQIRKQIHTSPPPLLQQGEDKAASTHRRRRHPPLYDHPLLAHRLAGPPPSSTPPLLSPPLPLHRFPPPLTPAWHRAYHSCTFPFTSVPALPP